MPFISHSFDIPGDNTYDAQKIEVDGGAILRPDVTKTMGLWQLDGPGNTAIDESPNGYNFNYTGTTALWVPGQVNNAWQPEGNNYFIAPDVNWYNITVSQTFTLMAWFKKTNDGQSRWIFVKKQGSGLYRGYGLQLNLNGRIQVFITYTTAKQISIQTTQRFDDGNWHQVLFCYDGTATAAGVTIYVDNIVRSKDVLSDTLLITDDIQTTVPALIGGPSGTSPWVDLLDQVIIWNTCLNINQINYMYNAGLGREKIPRYINPSPSIYKTTGHSAPIGDNARYNGFSVTYTMHNEGVVGVQVSIDGGLTWLIYNINTQNWEVPVGNESNTVSTVNSNIITIAEPPLPSNINIRLFLISLNGFEEVQVLNYTITYTEGLGPEIIIGPGKTSFDNEVIIPFATTTFSDPDGNVIKAEWRSYVISHENTTPQIGSSNTIYLATNADPSDDYYNGKTIALRSSTNQIEFHVIIDYVGSSRLATIADTWENIPEIGNFYSIGDIVESNWTEIIKGAWATLVDAVQNFSHAFRTVGPAYTAIRLYLRVTDDDTPSNSAIDSKTISVNPYSITIDVRDPQEVPMTDFLFTPGDGRSAITQDSPFDIFYQYGDFVMKVDKNDYITTNQLIQVRVTGVTEFIVLNQNLTLANLDQIWLVQLANVQEPGTVGLALGTIVNTLLARPIGQVPLAIANVTWLNRFKECNVFRIYETPLLTLRGDEDLTNADNPFFEIIDPDGNKMEKTVLVSGVFASYQVLNGELNKVGKWRIRIVADNLGAFQGGTTYTTFTVIDEND